MTCGNSKMSGNSSGIMNTMMLGPRQQRRGNSCYCHTLHEKIKL